MDIARLCYTCRWGWGFMDETGAVVNDYGACHRYAPKPSEAGGKVTDMTTWPGVHISHGCGEWNSQFD